MCVWKVQSEFGVKVPNICKGLIVRIWRRKWQPTPVLLLGESHGGRSLVGYSPWGLKESDMTERLHFHFTFFGMTKPGGCQVFGVSHRRMELPSFLSTDHTKQQLLLCHLLWCGAMWYGVVWVVLCRVVWSGWCGVVSCGVMWCHVVWCCVVWYGVVCCAVVWCEWCGVV